MERKYKLYDAIKAIKIVEGVINKTNTTLEEFIYATVGSLESLEGLVDGNITTYYRSGTPTMEKFPTNTWNEEDYSEHIDDLYYDKDSGYAYIFTFEDETESYVWKETNARYIIQALAMANSASDTADGKRRVFTETPITPYENGDLWFKEGEIYICQISKTDQEPYAEEDFIIATMYTDDTVANKIGDELEVLKGTVLTIKEGEDEFRAQVEDRDRETTSSIQLLRDMFKTLVTDENGESMMSQEGDKFTFSMKNVIESMNAAHEDIETLSGGVSKNSEAVNSIQESLGTLEEIADYVVIGSKNGKPCIELGETDSSFKVVITNTEILFMDGSDIPAYVSNKALNITKAVVKEELGLGDFVWEKRSNGNWGFYWRGN